MDFTPEPATIDLPELAAALSETELAEKMKAEARTLTPLETLSPSQRVLLVERRAHLFRCELSTILNTLALPTNHAHTLGDLFSLGWTKGWQAEMEHTLSETALGPKPDSLERPLPTVRHLNPEGRTLAGWAVRAAKVLALIKPDVGAAVGFGVNVELPLLVEEARSAGLLPEVKAAPIEEPACPAEPEEVPAVPEAPDVPLPWTQEQIQARAREVSTSGRDFFGVETKRLVSALDFEHAKEFLKPSVSEGDWTPEIASYGDVVSEIRSYLPFAWEKARGQRGLSAGRSLSHFAGLVWLLGPDYSGLVGRLLKMDDSGYGEALLQEVGDLDVIGYDAFFEVKP